MTELQTKPCGRRGCSVSTAISGHLTFGRGGLDEWGFWGEPCQECARRHEQEFPNMGKCWPFEHPSHADLPGWDECYDNGHRPATIPH